MTSKRDHAGVWLPPPLLYVIPFMAGVALHRAVGRDAFPRGTHAPATIAGIAFAAAGAFLVVAAQVQFRRAGTSMIPIRPTTAMVMNGAYRFTRNPMYVGLALLYVGLALIGGFAWPLAFLPLVILAVDRLAIQLEERYLEQKFGEPYRRYCETVRRWL